MFVEVFLEGFQVLAVSKRREIQRKQFEETEDAHKPAVLIVGENVALVLDAGDAVVVLMPRSKHLVERVVLLTTLLRVLRSVVPEK